MSKIESGTISLEIGDVQFLEMQDYVERGFRQIAKEKGIDFEIELDPQLPKAVNTDAKRLQQVLRNLLSNALKFTEKGKVALSMKMATGGWGQEQDILNRSEHVLAFSVRDTGIGIPFDKQKIIFEAFQQVDMTTSRKYGGTGLGLSISREIAQMLGGEIRVESVPGQGSTFTLYLPLSFVPTTPRPAGMVNAEALKTMAAEASPKIVREKAEVAPPPLPIDIEDDRSLIESGDKILLIIEDDAATAKIMREMGRKAGFKVLAANLGGSGLDLAQKYLPHAITLDLHLPDMDGWAVFDLLKNNPETRHIPIHIISCEEQQGRALSQGAFAYLVKPTSGEVLAGAIGKMKAYIERPVKRLLVIEDNDAQRKGIVELLGSENVEIVPASTGEEALSALKTGRFDCMVLDLKLPDMTGFSLISKVKRELGITDLPIIIYTGKELTTKEERHLRKVTQSIIVKDARSPERLLDEVSLFMHQVQARLAEPKQRMLEELHKSQPLLAGKTVLIVDDDVRNIFALTGALERYQMKALYAENGKQGLQMLQTNPGIDIVLMDIMMPNMDGYETMRAIRHIEQHKNLPIIALTAKAMRGDREKCIEAGASDYIPKPVDMDQLLSLLRVWLYRYVYGQ